MVKTKRTLNNHLSPTGIICRSLVTYNANRNGVLPRMRNRIPVSLPLPAVKRECILVAKIQKLSTFKALQVGNAGRLNNQKLM